MTILGLSVETADRTGLATMWIGFGAGAIALVATSLSAYLLYRSSSAVQQVADERIASANERASAAARDAENERLERVKLEERIAPRRLTRTQQESIAVDLSKFERREILVKTYALDAEGAILGKQLIECFGRARLNVIDRTASESGLGGFALGIYVYGPDAELVNAVVQSVTARTGLAATQGLDPALQHAPNISVGQLEDASVRAIVLVGVKPLPQ
jgi:hypothetical protein